MKGNKKILVIAALLLLIATSFTTYAIYKSSATGDSSISTAAWVVEVNDSDIVHTNTFTLDNITWATPRVGQNNKIAPGDHGTVQIVIDASGSEVGVSYDVEVDFSALEDNDGNTNFDVDIASGSDPLSGTIAYGATMTKTITLDITWTAVDNEDANQMDVDLAGQQFNLPVTVTVTQNPNPAA